MHKRITFSLATLTPGTGSRRRFIYRRPDPLSRTLPLNMILVKGAYTILECIYFYFKMEVCMRKLILMWLFGTDDIEDYLELLRDTRKYTQKCLETSKKHLETIHQHLDTLKEERENLDVIRKLIKVCENHGIDVDEEIKHVEL
jgi:hypothetical protein